MKATLTMNRVSDRQRLRLARRTLTHKSKSFSWAGRFFDRETAEDVATLYQFCRLVDDIADHQQPRPARRQLAAIRSDLANGHSAHRHVKAFIDMARRRGIDPQVPALLVEAVANDTGAVRLASQDELVQYAYGVASTVGLMMCALMKVRDSRARPFAVDLGIAMQLTNIARDVVEDARRDRRYLPGDWFDTALGPADILAAEPDTRRRVLGARARLLDLASVYYRSAEGGMHYIPWRARMAVMTAARLYEAIGGRMRSGFVGWGERAFVDRAGKIRETLRAWASLLLDPKFWHRGRHPNHAAELHRALAGRPGVNDGAP